jgi:hypothetical protein
MDSPHPEKLQGVSAKKKQLLSLKTSLEAVAKVDLRAVKDTEIHGYNAAISQALSAVNALITASNAQCTLDTPPADIDIIPDSSGALIYRCEHAKPHKWKLNGDRI